MVNIRPFRGIRYNITKVKDMNLVFTPHNDKIDRKVQNELYERSPYNFVRIYKNKEKDKYTSAKCYLENWIKDEIFIRENEDCFYMYSQEFEFERAKKVRRGFIGLLELEEYETGNILPHENTLPGPKKDKLDLLLATEATFGQIFMLYSDPDDIIGKELLKLESIDPDITTKDENGNIHRLWKIHDKSLTELIPKEMKNKKLYIADGHHRYETSIDYRNIKRKEQYSGQELFNYTMCTFSNMNDENGMSILPSHRFIKNIEKFDLQSLLNGLKKDFDILLSNDLEDLSSKLELNKDKHVFGLIANKAKTFYLLTLKGNIHSYFPSNYPEELMNLDVFILHKVILENRLSIDDEKLKNQTHVDYFRNREEAFYKLQNGDYQLGFLLNATKIEDIKRVTESGEKMPQKSTDFYPKLLSGLVINILK